MRRRHRPSRARPVSLPQLLPNLLTLGSICAGLTAIRFSIDGRYGEAVWLIVLAAILDALDGRMARMLRSESAIGAELDSLADFLNFGVATGLLLYLSTLSDVSSFGWIAVLIYVICCVMRLARFNVDSRQPPPSPSPGPSLGGFIGVPSPAGALLALMPVFLRRAMPDLPEVPGIVPTVWLILVGFLLISRIPTPSLKLLRFRADQLPSLLVLLVAILALLFTYPWWTLLAVDLAYLCLLLWSVANRRRLAKGNTDDAP